MTKSNGKRFFPFFTITCGDFNAKIDLETDSMKTALETLGQKIETKEANNYYFYWKMDNTK